jgi:hypothetical protein
MLSFLTLPLLVARIVADDPDRAVPADHLALVAHLFDRRANLHGIHLSRVARVYL